MKPSTSRTVRLVIAAVVLISSVLLVLGGLAYWKYRGITQAMQAGGWQEPAEAVVFATSQAVEYRASVTTIGTVVPSRWVVLKNELAGTVRSIELTPGAIVEAGQTLVNLDVAVEEAELHSAEARVRLAGQMLERQQQAAEALAGSQMELDRAQAEMQQAEAEISRIKAIIDRKSLRAPFRARVGLVDTHIGQYLAEGTEITTLLALDGYSYVDFALTQNNALGVAIGHKVEAELPTGEPRLAEILASDAQADAATRNVTFRARIADEQGVLRAGSSLRLTVQRGGPVTLVGVPVSALRRTPQGEMVYTVTLDKEQKTRAVGKPVRSGPTVGGLTLLRGGLDPGVKIIATGSFKLRDGSLVQDVGAAGQPSNGPAGSAGGGAASGPSGASQVAGEATKAADARGG
jgi:membrane fusion protein, multidrug efflux system